jgi:hypothetical protein
MRSASARKGDATNTTSESSRARLQFVAGEWREVSVPLEVYDEGARRPPRGAAEPSAKVIDALALVVFVLLALWTIVVALREWLTFRCASG